MDFAQIGNWLKELGVAGALLIALYIQVQQHKAAVAAFASLNADNKTMMEKVVNALIADTAAKVALDSDVRALKEEVKELQQKVK